MASEKDLHFAHMIANGKIVADGASEEVKSGKASSAEATGRV
jgi:hypothetical protein